MLKILYLLLLLPSYLKAHPVSYQDSLLIASQHSDIQGEQLLIYSQTYYLGLGLSATRLQKDWIYAPQISLLAKRWNLPAAQANIYLYGGYGVLDRDSKNSTDGITRIGTQIDYETRKIFSAIKYRRFDTFNDYNADTYTLQLGFAPYLAGFEELNTWLISEWSYTPKYKANGDGTLFLRFFYKNIYWEIGSSFEGETMFNFMVHYNP
jgi:hypothetical protein